MTEKSTIYVSRPIESFIRMIRDQRVILDVDLAQVYGVTTKRLNEQVKRNVDRFPTDFAFQLVPQEVRSSRSQFATLKRGHNVKYLPYAFTEHGAIMAANVLTSPQAVKMSVFVVRAFVKMREQLVSRSEMEKRLLQAENILLSHDDHIRDIYKKIRPLLLPPPEPPPTRKIGFHVREKRAMYRVRSEKRVNA